MTHPPQTSSPAAALRDAVLPLPVFDFWAGKINPLWSWNRPLARIVSRHTEARDTVTLTLQANRHFRGFRAGQHLNVSAEINGRRHSRSYSPSAGHGAQFSITVKKMPGGVVSGWLCEHAQPGDVVELGQAYGDLTNATLCAPAVFLAAGSGITPFISLIRAQAALGMPFPISLLYWAGSREELCFVEELQGLAGSLPGLNVHFLLTRGEQADGRISLAQLQKRLPGLGQASLHACGPQGFVDEAGRLAALLARPFAGEAFSPPRLVTNPGQPVNITLKRSQRVVTIASGTPLLQALEDQGLRPASGCRRGICNTCACDKASGSSRNLLTGDMGTEPTAALRLCISSAESDLVLDL